METIDDIIKFNLYEKTESGCKKRHPILYDFLKQKYNNIPIGECIYLYTHNLNTRPTCIECGSENKFRGIYYGYSTYCSQKCARRSPAKIKKARQTSLERYGVDNPAKAQIIKDRAKQTSLERYGVDNPAKAQIIKDRAKQTCLERYGVEFALQNEDIKRRVRESFKKTKKLTNIKYHPDFIDYDNDNDNLWIMRCPHPECNKCLEKVYKIDSNNILNRTRDNIELCTNLLPIGEYRGKNTSIELYIKNILENNNIDFIQSDRKILSGKELDFYIPTYNLAIECNGCYWHSSEQLDKKHYNKFINCKEKGIQLLTVWEDQIVNSPEKIKSILLSKLGIYKRRLYARECSIHLVDSVHCREFLDCYHLQGSVNSSVRLGLYHNDELISVMTFGKGRKCLNSSDEWELYRYCCKSEVQVIGGASKLFKYFISNYHPNSVISFSSNDISDGSLYRVLGFEEQSNSIGYWYIDRYFNRYHRYKFTKQRLIKEGFNPNLSEREIMKSRGFYCIHDSGQTKWIFKQVN